MVKWFHSEGETEFAEARAIRAAHARGDLNAHILDLGVYELGNVFVRALKWSSTDVADQLDDVRPSSAPRFFSILMVSALPQRWRRTIS